MTKKDFIALADAIKDYDCNRKQINRFTHDQIQALANFCRSQNPAFKEQLWLDYIAGECGPNGGKK